MKKILGKKWKIWKKYFSLIFDIGDVLEFPLVFPLASDRQIYAKPFNFINFGPFSMIFLVNWIEFHSFPSSFLPGGFWRRGGKNFFCFRASENVPPFNFVNFGPFSIIFSGTFIKFLSFSIYFFTGGLGRRGGKNSLYGIYKNSSFYTGVLNYVIWTDVTDWWEKCY